MPRVAAPQAASAFLPSEIQAIVNSLPPLQLPTVAALQAASAPLLTERQAIVINLKQKIIWLTAQYAAMKEQAALIVAEKRKINIEFVALEQRRLAVEEKVAAFGLQQQNAAFGFQQQKMIEDLKKVKQALDTMAEAEHMWSRAAEIALAL